MSMKEFYNDMVTHTYTKLKEIKLKEIVDQWCMADIDDGIPFGMIIFFKEFPDVAFSFQKRMKVTTTLDSNLDSKVKILTGMDIASDVDFQVDFKVHCRKNISTYFMFFLHNLDTIYSIKHVELCGDFITIEL